MAMVLAHHTVRWMAALVLLAAFMLAVVIGCRSGPSTTTPSSRGLATFRGGSGTSETAHFITTGDWELLWTCQADVGSFSVSISVMNGGPSPVVSAYSTTCDLPSGVGQSGTVDVHQSGEQWLFVAMAGDVGAGDVWIATVLIPQSDTGAKVLPLPSDTTGTPVPPE